MLKWASWPSEQSLRQSQGVEWRCKCGMIAWSGHGALCPCFAMAQPSVQLALTALAFHQATSSFTVQLLTHDRIVPNIPPPPPFPSFLSLTVPRPTPAVPPHTRLPTLQKLDIKLKGMSVVLCNDKQSSFGAPDVLQACVDHMSLAYKIDSL